MFLPVEEVVKQAHDGGKGELCAADVDRLRQWRFHLRPEDEKDLTDSGRVELRGLGERFRARFPGLLDQPFDQEKYLVRAYSIFTILALNVSRLILSVLVSFHGQGEGHRLGRCVRRWRLSG